MKNSADILIAGNGILAMSTAYALAKAEPQLKIIIIGPAERNNAATTAAGAMLNCFAEVTSQTFTSPHAKKKLTTAIQANGMWKDWLASINADSHLADLNLNYGTHVILNAQNGGIDDDNFSLIKRALNEFNVPHQEVDGRDLMGYNPIPTYRALRALYLPEEAYISSNHILTTLDHILQHLPNVTIINSDVKTIRATASAFEITLPDQQVISGDQVLIAAGAFSQALVSQFPQISSRIPAILSSVGCSMLVKSNIKLDSVIRTPGRAGSCGLHMVPGADNTLYLGATAYFSRHTQQNIKMRYLYNLQKNVIQQFNQKLEGADIVKFFYGNRPVTIDGFPLIGQTSVKGLWMATGTYRDGFHNSPLIGQYLADQILKRQTIKFDNPFTPERQPMQVMTQQESIELVTKHSQAAFYEYGASYPINGLKVEDYYADGLKRELKEIYEKLQTEIALPAELLILLLRASPEDISYFKRVYQNYEHKPSLDLA